MPSGIVIGSIDQAIQGLQESARYRHQAQGLWYPSTAWGLVGDPALGDVLRDFAAQHSAMDCVGFLGDFASERRPPCALAPARRAHYHDTYFALDGAAGGGAAPWLLNLAGEDFDTAQALFGPAAAAAAAVAAPRRLWQRLFRTPQTTRQHDFLARVAYGIDCFLTGDALLRQFWASPQFLRHHAAQLVRRRQAAAAAAPVRSPVRPRPLVPFGARR